ncbi:MAG: YeeE/YedE family protein [Alphaproteobacteria bacterium]|jgi:uncharacterized membrane protein YedE/YeeE|nr:YeeE/YedE family protein [Alphaproteobacteria bacterium]
MTTIAETAARRPPTAPIDRPVAWGAAIGLAALAALVSEIAGARHAVLVLIGGALGAVLYHAAFGFTGGWRQLIVHGRGAGLRAQCLTIAIAAVPFAAMFAWGSPLGHGVWGSVGPLGVSVAVGGFLFGAGMQLGGGCGSGTLFTVGGGNMRMVVTLACFILGSLIGTAHMPFWLSLPHAGWMTWTDVTGGALGGLGEEHAVSLRVNPPRNQSKPKAAEAQKAAAPEDKPAAPEEDPRSPMQKLLDKFK